MGVLCTLVHGPSAPEEKGDAGSLIGRYDLCRYRCRCRCRHICEARKFFSAKTQGLAPVDRETKTATDEDEMNCRRSLMYAERRWRPSVSLLRSCRPKEAPCLGLESMFLGEAPALGYSTDY